MLGRHARREGLRLIESALEKAATGIEAPSLATMKAKKTRELGALPDANIPKVVSFPAT